MPYTILGIRHTEREVFEAGTAAVALELALGLMAQDYRVKILDDARRALTLTCLRAAEQTEGEALRAGTEGDAISEATGGRIGCC